MYFTPMMLAHEFVRSEAARDSDFTTCDEERDTSHALIAQFAASESNDFARAAEMISPWVDGIDLNCGCPQSWALKEGIGCSLMEDAELVAKMVVAAKSRMPCGKSLSCKIRIHKDIKCVMTNHEEISLSVHKLISSSKTVQFVRTLEKVGVDFITVHGRTRTQRSSTRPDYAAIKTIKQHICIPVIANGDCYHLTDVNRIVCETDADGVMAARGILENPALFSGVDQTPIDCVLRFLNNAVRYPIPFALVLHHVSAMTAYMPGTGKKECKALMACRDLVELITFAEDTWGPKV